MAVAAHNRFASESLGMTVGRFGLDRCRTLHSNDGGSYLWESKTSTTLRASRFPAPCTCVFHSLHEDRTECTAIAPDFRRGEFGGEFASAKSVIDAGKDRLRRSIPLYNRQIV